MRDFCVGEYVIGICLERNGASVSALRDGQVSDVCTDAGETFFPCEESLYEDLNRCTGLFRELKNRAQIFLGGPVEKAAVSVPCGFSLERWQTVYASARSAGFQRIRLVPKSAASAVCHAERIQWEGRKESRFLLAIQDKTDVELSAWDLEAEVLESRGIACIRDTVTKAELRQFAAEAGLSVSSVRQVFLCGTPSESLKAAFAAAFGRHAGLACVREECAQGAALITARMTGMRDDAFLVLMSLPFSLGIRTRSGETLTLIEKNCMIPARSGVRLKPRDFEGNRAVFFGRGDVAGREWHVTGEYDFTGLLAGAGPEDDVETSMSIDADLNIFLRLCTGGREEDCELFRIPMTRSGDAGRQLDGAMCYERYESLSPLSGRTRSRYERSREAGKARILL